MHPNSVREILKKAGEAVADLPDHLQSKAFELAVSMLKGETPSVPALESEHPGTGEGGRRAGAALSNEVPDVSDVLGACKRNPDRYLVFLRDIESAGAQADTPSLGERFRKYKQDLPKLPSRDLGEMVAKGLIEQVGRGRDATFVLKRKGRERLAELDAAINVE